MATSLYDQFHSDTNIDHVFNILNDLIHKQTGETIKNDINHSNYYRNSLRDIFVKSDKDTLEGLNREVLTHNLRYFLNILKTVEKPVQETNCESEGIFSPVAGIIGTLLANEVLKTILQLKDDLNNNVLIFNSLHTSLRKTKSNSIPSCLNKC